MAALRGGLFLMSEVPLCHSCQLTCLSPPRPFSSYKFNHHRSKCLRADTRTHPPLEHSHTVADEHEYFRLQESVGKRGHGAGEHLDDVDRVLLRERLDEAHVLRRVAVLQSDTAIVSSTPPLGHMHARR